MLSGTTQEEHLSRWTVLSAVRSAPGLESFIAARDLCSKYWPPIYAYLRRHNQTGVHAAESTSGFCAHLAEGNFLRYPCRKHACFRTLVQVSLEDFCEDPWQREQALNRPWSSFFARPSAEELS